MNLGVEGGVAILERTFVPLRSWPLLFCPASLRLFSLSYPSFVLVSPPFSQPSKRYCPRRRVADKTRTMFLSTFSKLSGFKEKLLICILFFNLMEMKFQVYLKDL